MSNIKAPLPIGLIIEITKAATDVLNTYEVSGTSISNYGQGAAMTLTFPPAAEGYSFLFNVITTGNAIHLKAGASDKIYLNGVALDDADKASNSTPVAGDSITFWTFLTAASTWDWQAAVGVGTWIDGGA